MSAALRPDGPATIEPEEDAAVVRPEPRDGRRAEEHEGPEPASVVVTVPVDRGDESRDHDEEEPPPCGLDRHRIRNTRGRFVEARRRRRRASNGRYLLEFQLKWRPARDGEPDPRPVSKQGWVTLRDYEDLWKLRRMEDDAMSGEGE